MRPSTFWLLVSLQSKSSRLFWGKHPVRIAATACCAYGPPASLEDCPAPGGEGDSLLVASSADPQPSIFRIHAVDQIPSSSPRISTVRAMLTAKVGADTWSSIEAAGESIDLLHHL